MRLLSNISQLQSSYMEATGAESSAGLEQGLQKGMDAIMGKQPGQSVTGEILLVKGNEILLSMGENQLLQAKLTGSMGAQPGQQLTFQIMNNSGAKVVLSPLYENLSADPSISKALEAAGLPKNEVTAGMVKAMMQEGMPIDRQSLYQMNRIVNQYPEVSLQTLTQMQRLSLPVTPENIGQFEAYKNYEHQLSESLSDIVESFGGTARELTGSGDVQEGVRFYQQVLNILTDGQEMPETEEETAPPKGQEGAVLKAEAGQGQEPEAGKVPEGQGKGALAEVLSREELGNLAEGLQKANFPKNLVSSAATGQMDVHTFLKELGKELQAGTAPESRELLSLLDGKEFKAILKKDMQSQWMLEPQEVAKERSVDKLYERLDRQMNQLSQALSQTARADTPLGRTVSNVSGNIDFMNQLNQMFAYVQIPLKLQNQEANGELFVYTNKKSLARKDDSISALLHLDMEHLGSVDVHVTLSGGERVSTKFYMQDDASLDLIAEHIDMLNQRLEKQGYTMSAEFINRDEETNVMEEILKQDKNISILSEYSFDARA